MQKLLKNNKGFTLVEVIVVAVIVLILAAVAIPLYNGYIDDSRQASVENVAGALAGALGAGEQIGWGTLTVNQATSQAAGSIVITPNGGQVNTIIIPKNMAVNAMTTGSTQVIVTTPIEGGRQRTATVQWK